MPDNLHTTQNINNKKETADGRAENEISSVSTPRSDTVSISTIPQDTENFNKKLMSFWKGFDKNNIQFILKNKNSQQMGDRVQGNPHIPLSQLLISTAYYNYLRKQIKISNREKRQTGERKIFGYK